MSVSNYLEEAARFAKKQGTPDYFIELVLEVPGILIQVRARSSGQKDRLRFVSYPEIERAKCNVLIEAIKLAAREFEHGVAA